MVELDRLCDPDRESLRVPSVIEVAGVTWTCATNGTSIVGLVTPGAVVTEPMDVWKTVATWLAEPPHGVEVSLGDLRAFAGPAVWDWPCEKCDGSGSTNKCGRCHGTGKVDCSCCDCGDEHRADCTECDGDMVGRPRPCLDCKDGRVSKMPSSERDIVDAAVNIVGITLDGRRLAQVLACLPDLATVRIAGDGSQTMLMIWGEGCHGRLVMVRTVATRRF